jgi:hypothetical protein
MATLSVLAQNKEHGHKLGSNTIHKTVVLALPR